MADIELVIKIDEEYIKQIDKIKFLVGGRTDRKLQLKIIKAIKNGTPLSKRMLSVDLIIKTLCPKDEDYDYPCIAPSYLEKELERLLLDDSPTADKEQGT